MRNRMALRTSGSLRSTHSIQLPRQLDLAAIWLSKSHKRARMNLRISDEPNRMSGIIGDGITIVNENLISFAYGINYIKKQHDTEFLTDLVIVFFHA
jgi:hypothetical protein